MDSTGPNQVEYHEALKPDFRDQHCEFEEKIGPTFLEPLMKEIQTNIFACSNHEQNNKTEKHVTGLIGFLGSTPVL